MKSLRIAVLIDGSFFIKRYFKLFPNAQSHSPFELVNNLYNCALRHVGNGNYLYRIFYYDCNPLTKRVHNPVSRLCINFDKTDQAIFRRQLFEELKKKRKVALRLGYIKDSGNWVINPRYTKELLNGSVKVEDLSDGDLIYELRQKGIDMKIGVDIASLAFKKLVDKIVLISGDSDFVPAAKLARTEGVDFVLDPMWNPIDEFLFEHIDGLHSTCPKPKKIGHFDM